MINKRFIFRQLTKAKKQSAVFVLCVALSMVTLVALSGFGDSINNSLQRDARELQAADIIISSNYAHPEQVEEAVQGFVEQGLVDKAKVYTFSSVVRVLAEDNSLLSNLKVVEPGYPFYGEVELASGRHFEEVLTPGNVVVEQMLLDRLALKVGDELRVGQQTLTIADLVSKESDRPVDFFTFGPRVFVAAADLEGLELVKPGSRVRYITLLKVHQLGDLERLAAELEEVAPPGQVRIETFKTADSQVQEFFERFLLFLSLVAIFTLLLAGIGIQSSLTAYLKEREKTIAIVKTVGATSQFVTRHYLVVAVILGTVGTILGLGAGFLSEIFMPILFQRFLPPNVELIISARAIAESLLLGLFVVGVFTFLPIYQLQELKPNFILQKEQIPLKRGWAFYLAILIILLFFAGMVFWKLQDLRISLYFVGGVIGLVLLTAFLTEIVLYTLKRSQIKALAPRQALRGLFRPRNATGAIIITLAASLAVIFCIYLIERNLDASFVRSFPPDAPNLFFVDIQPEQKEGFSKLLGIETDFFPVIRSRIRAVNGVEINREAEEDRARDNLARPFTLSYRTELLEGERVIQGGTLFDDSVTGTQVSVLDEMLRIRQFELGDVISFDIQGVPLDATITSIRTNTEESSQPLFDFILPPDILLNAPQTIFTAVTVPPAQIQGIQNKIVAAYPNISVVNVSEAINTLAEIVREITRIVRFFSIFSIVAGVLIIISSVFATRFARIQEAVYFKVLGAKQRFVLKVFALENIFLGLVSGLLAVLLAQIGSWLIITRLFEQNYKPFIIDTLLLIIATTLLVTIVGLLASISILTHRPITFLREQTVE